MKKLLAMICAATLIAVLAIGAAAAETVIYKNDFSDPETLWDFNQYRMRWEIRDGHLYMTDQALDAAGKVDPESTFGHIIWQGNPVDNCVIDVDLYGACTQSGVVFRSQKNSVVHKNSGIAGYLAFVSQDVVQGAIGAGNLKGEWQDVLNSGLATKHLFPGVNVHFNIIVKDQKVGVKITNIDNGKLVYDAVYTIGSNAKGDPIYTDGVFGFRMRAKYKDQIASNNAYFDNLVVTTANEAVPAKTEVNTTAVTINTKNLTPIYTNNFDDASALDDFLQLYGTWDVQDGKLYLTDVGDKSNALILYNGDEKLATMENYVMDVDVYNVQTQGGPIIRCDLPSIEKSVETGDGNNFFGYHGYIAFAGNQVALGYGGPNGAWGGLVNNAASPKDTIKPGANIHLQLAVNGTNFQVTVYDMQGTPLWKTVQYHDMWEEGTFGFRLYAKLRDDGLDNVANTAFDNLVISALPDSVTKTEVKMTVDSMTAFVNGVATTLDAAPVIKNDRTMLPVRFVAENLGGTVGWDAATQTVSITANGVDIKITIGAATAKINGADIALDSPAYIDATNNRTYLPVRVVAENLGATVGWDAATRTATLTK